MSALHLLDDSALAGLAGAEQQQFNVLRGLHAILFEHLLDLPALLDRIALLCRHRAAHCAFVSRARSDRVGGANEVEVRVARF